MPRAHCGSGRRAGIALLLALVPVGVREAVAQDSAASHAAVPDSRVQEGTLSFDGRATVGDFTGTTSTVSGELTGGPTLADVRGWAEAPVRTLETGNDRRDRDMNKSMESEEFPVIRFDLARVAPGETSGDTTAVTLVGTFTIHGVQREVELPARVVRRSDGFRLQSDFPLNLKDYEIGGLSKMLGMLKMQEEIVVHVDLLFAPR